MTGKYVFEMTGKNSKNICLEWLLKKISYLDWGDLLSERGWWTWRLFGFSLFSLNRPYLTKSAGGTRRSMSADVTSPVHCGRGHFMATTPSLILTSKYLVGWKMRCAEEEKKYAVMHSRQNLCSQLERGMPARKESWKKRNLKEHNSYQWQLGHSPCKFRSKMSLGLRLKWWRRIFPRAVCDVSDLALLGSKVLGELSWHSHCSSWEEGDGWNNGKEKILWGLSRNVSSKERFMNLSDSPLQKRWGGCRDRKIRRCRDNLIAIHFCGVDEVDCRSDSSALKNENVTRNATNTPINDLVVVSYIGGIDRCMRLLAGNTHF